MRILVIGDVVGGPGRRILARALPGLRERHRFDAVVVNAENAAGGRGLTLPLAEELFAVGADVLTLGDHVWDQREFAGQIDRDPRLVRPANLPPGCPGRGWTTVATPAGPLTVVSLLGRVFMGPAADCPFRCADALLRALPAPTGPVLVDLHAEATSEKIAMGWHLDGRVAAVIGSHTHVQTADERILPRGTACLSDLGMTGPERSILGRNVDAVLRRFMTGMPQRFDVADGPAVLEGLRLELHPATGRCRRLARLRLREEELPV